MQYSNEQIEQLNKDLEKLEETFYQMFYFIHPPIIFSQKRANEFFRHGFSRRFQTLKHCIDKVFEIYPPERTEVLGDEEKLDLDVYIQSFFINIYGAIDNLAWIVKEEKELELTYTSITLYNPKIQQYFTEEFKGYLNGGKNAFGTVFKDWYEKHCKNFRHAVGHRIPLYVPPSGIADAERYSEIAIEKRLAILSKDFDKVEELNQEEISLEHILPFYVHSFEEDSPYMIIHPQLISDFRTLIELSDKFLDCILA